MARAKQTNRAEARRRYRQTTNLPMDDLEGVDEAATAPVAEARTVGQPAARSDARPATSSSGRPSFIGAFRAAYRPAHPREDLRHLPALLRSRAFLASVALVLLGALGQILFPRYTGSAFAWELLVLPGSALAPQLVAGFFAPRASYILGFIVGLLQGIVFTLFVTQFAARIGTALPPDQIGNLFVLSFVTGPISGTLFAAAAAWYRRFLALSSPRRAAGGRGQARATSRTASRRPAGR